MTSTSGDAPPLSEQLEAYRRQFDVIEIEARKIADGLTDLQLTWEPGRGAWSIRDCFDHLIVTGRQSLVQIAETLAEGRARVERTFQGRSGSGCWSVGWCGLWSPRRV
jgi:hypothetical protein